MKPVVLLDTGPLVAFLNARDRFHAWASEQLGQVSPPLLTCEAVVSESLFLLRNRQGGHRAVVGLLESGFVQLPFRLQEHLSAVSQLLQRYAEVPMSLPDGCLVRMSELHDAAVVLTLDSDFGVYRRHRRQAIPTLRPKQ